MTNNNLTGARLDALTKEMQDCAIRCRSHGYTKEAEEYEDMVSGLVELKERRKTDEQEPVAWMHPIGACGSVVMRGRMAWNPGSIPLYTAPRLPVEDDKT